MKTEQAIARVMKELGKYSEGEQALQSIEEGAALIRQQHDYLWQTIIGDHTDGERRKYMRQEAARVAARSLQLMIDCT